MIPSSAALALLPRVFPRYEENALGQEEKRVLAHGLGAACVVGTYASLARMCFFALSDLCRIHPSLPLVTVAGFGPGITLAIHEVMGEGIDCVATRFTGESLDSVSLRSGSAVGVFTTASVAIRRFGQPKNFRLPVGLGMCAAFFSASGLAYFRTEKKFRYANI
jgi:hypothetical protein